MADGRVAVSTLEWAHEELSWDKHHKGQHHTEYAFPTHHVEWLLRCGFQDVLLGDRMESQEELTADKGEHPEDHLLPLVGCFSIINLGSFDCSIRISAIQTAF